jgi:hypothetical protein
MLFVINGSYHSTVYPLNGTSIHILATKTVQVEVVGQANKTTRHDPGGGHAETGLFVYSTSETACASRATIGCCTTAVHDTFSTRELSSSRKRQGWHPMGRLHLQRSVYEACATRRHYLHAAAQRFSPLSISAAPSLEARGERLMHKRFGLDRREWQAKTKMATAVSVDTGAVPLRSFQQRDHHSQETGEVQRTSRVSSIVV